VALLKRWAKREAASPRLGLTQFANWLPGARFAGRRRLAATEPLRTASKPAGDVLTHNLTPKASSWTGSISALGHEPRKEGDTAVGALRDGDHP